MRILGPLVLVLLVTACSGASPQAAPSPSPTLPPPTASPTPVPSPTAPPVQVCQRPSFANLGFGFPRSEHRLPSTGRVNVIVLFADFEDAPATRSPQEVFSILSPGAEQFFAAQSYGRFDLQLQPHFVWLRLSQPSAHYGNSLTTYYEHLAFLQEAIDLADAELDFSQVQAVVLLANPDAYEIAYGPTYTGFLDSGLSADGVIIPNGMTSGRDLLHWGHLWLNHEMGHSLGLPDLYAYDLQEFIFAYTGGYSVMGNIFGHAPELTAFERWQLGWLDDEQILCLPSGVETEVSLTAIEQPGGLKALVTPLDDSRLLVVESRRALGYDQALEQPGALVYIVDANISSGYGPMQVLPKAADDPDLLNSTLAQGESVEVEGIRLQVIEHGAQFDRVQLSLMP